MSSRLERVRAAHFTTGDVLVASGFSAGHTLGRMGVAMIAVAIVGCRVPEAPSALDTLRCTAEVRDFLNTSGANLEPLTGPPTGTGGQVLRFRSGELGRWYVVTQESTGALAAVERSPDGNRAWEFGADCESVSRPRADGLPLAQSAGQGTPIFTDADLAAAIEASAPEPVAVYLWSPHMPLAVDGVAEILAAGASTGVHIEVVMIAHGDVDFARREAERVGMAREALRVASSVELLMRDGQVHAPSILIFTQDRASPVLPGYRNAEGYRRFINAFRSSDGG